MKKLLLLMMMATAALSAEETKPPENDLVTVPRRYVSSEGLTKAATGSAISPYLGMGREIGEAVKGGLESVVDVSNRFADTPVGKFTLFMVAWKIIGRSLLGLVVGLPLYLLGLYIWVSFARRIYFGRWVWIRNSEGKKVQVREDPVKFGSGDAKIGLVILMVALLIVWTLGMFAAVIF